MSAPGLENGLKIIEYIIQHKEVGFNQLKTDLALSPASLNRYLKVLTGQNFLTKLENGQYSLGNQLYKYVTIDSPIQKYTKYIYPLLKNISNKLNLTSLLISYEQGKMICKEKYLFPYGVVMQDVGEIRTDYIMNPWGILFLAHCSPKERDFYIHHSHSKSINYINLPSIQRIEEYITFFHDFNYVCDNGEIFKHLVRLAIPLYDKENNLIASIVVGGNDSMFTPNKVKDYVKIINEEIQYFTDNILN